MNKRIEGIDLVTEKALFAELDKQTVYQIAEDWAFSVATANGSRESTVIYQLYSISQPTKRKEEIMERFKFLTSEQGAIELSKLLE